MLFRKKVEKLCACCVHAGKLNSEQMLCAKRGFVPRGFRCFRFRYDPLKREPLKQKPKNPSVLDQMDFSL